MAVTPETIAIALGRTPPPSDDPVYAQWAMWIEDARRLIAARLGDLDELDQDTLDYVVREAVVARARRPDDVEQIDISVDDGRVSRRYSAGSGRVWIRDEWWQLLSPITTEGKAFEIDTMPSTGRRVLGRDYWWGTPTDRIPLP